MKILANRLIPGLFVLILSWGLGPPPTLAAPATSRSRALQEAPPELVVAAQSGDPEAQVELGRKLLAGEGVPQTEPEGAYWILQAAEKGLLRAQLIASQLYTDGQGVEPDEVKAFKWMQKAADQGDITAAYHLGVMCREGRGTTRDFVLASQWTRKSADQGYARAQFFLGLLYANGQGVPQSDKEAARWFRYAAEQGDPAAQYFLGTRYDTGKGVRTDYVEGYKWLNLAASQGNTTAMSAREKIVRKMTREQVEEAQRRSVAFVPRSQVKPSLEGARELDPDTPIEANGTGFFVSDDGYLLTAYHLVMDAQRVAVKKGKELLPATVVRTDPVNDLALLKISGTFKSLPLTPSSGVKIGDAVFTLGYPTLQTPPDEPKLAEGNVKALNGPQDDPRFFQVSLALRPGNTGGPVVDALGNIIAIAFVPPGTTVPTRPDTPFFFKALKGSYATVFLEGMVGILKPAATVQGRKFEDLVKEAQECVALVLAF